MWKTGCSDSQDPDAKPTKYQVRRDGRHFIGSDFEKGMTKGVDSDICGTWIEGSPDLFDADPEVFTALGSQHEYCIRALVSVKVTKEDGTEHFGTATSDW